MIIDTKDIRVAIQQLSEGIPEVVDLLVRVIPTSIGGIFGPWTPLLWLAGADVTGVMIKDAYWVLCRGDMDIFVGLISDLGSRSKTKGDIERMLESRSRP